MGLDNVKIGKMYVIEVDDWTFIINYWPREWSAFF